MVYQLLATALASLSLLLLSIAGCEGIPLSFTFSDADAGGRVAEYSSTITRGAAASFELPALPSPTHVAIFRVVPNGGGCAAPGCDGGFTCRLLSPGGKTTCANGTTTTSAFGGGGGVVSGPGGAGRGG